MSGIRDGSMDKEGIKEINLFSLRIKDEHLEKDYQVTVALESMLQYRVAMITGLLFYLFFIIVDRVTYLEAGRQLSQVRLYFVAPLIMVIFLSTYTKIYIRFSELFNLMAVIICGLGIVIMAFVGKNDPEISRVYVGMIIVFFYLYSFLKVSYLKALFVGSGLVALFISVAWFVDHLPSNVFFHMSAMLIVSNIVGVTVAYIIEHHSKTEFLLRRKLSETVIKDALTGLYNRHYFEHYCKADIESFIKRSEGVHNIERRIGYVKAAKYGLIMIDIDHFKRINDTFGHHSGDLVLKQFADILTNSVRRSDDVLRFGGEEFLIIVKLTAEDYLIQFMKKLGATIASYDFKINGNSVIGCTASFGMIALPCDATNQVEDLLKFADRALYRSKETGRNRGHMAYHLQGEIEYEEIIWTE